MDLWLVGYGAWPASTRAARLVEALGARGVNVLIDVRLNPCSADPVVGRPYGPKPWNLQAGGAGIVALLAEAGIGYEWLVELGNPQRQDPAMAVLRAQIGDLTGGWPVHRGLERLESLVRTEGAACALLCACGDGRRCHRTVVAAALNNRHFEGKLNLREVHSSPSRGDSRSLFG
jgi:uncharacterized protein (DUF488 family)